ncbi:MAG TPA: bifunctional methylenetetrahydrofolate dehydrogenase/methenyltetrahydrofolate cyclohydrolase FolD [Firmicutes bacterium]|nr:bifunctional methylenetetrahydrofolate dehydrogenase/methenyltetrahydrofolate cyclohydrolase FolD [Bacillota bacterium]
MNNSPAKILDGKALAARVREGLKKEVAQLTAEGFTPGLAVILVGDDPASQVYVRNKERACAELGIKSWKHHLPADTSQKDLVQLVERINADPEVNGILVQLPLPAHIQTEAVLDVIDPAKDVDGFHPVNLGLLTAGRPGIIPCTPAGVMELVKESGVDVTGKECVIVGRSNIVGKPLAFLFLQEHGTVTICHSRTRDLAEVCRRADILVVATGRPGLVNGGMVKPGAVVIDVGINRTAEGKLTGDVDFASAVQQAGAITPVPGGVGPMTIAMLMKNTVAAARRAVQTLD